MRIKLIKKLIIIFIKFLNYLLILIPILLNVAFITLLERKILAYSQFRVGPNKVSFIGTLQPIADAVKLFLNQSEGPFSRNYFIYYFSPAARVLLVLFLWRRCPLFAGYHIYIYTILLILTILRLGVYPLLLAGWSSNRKYALLGGLRGVAQTISYEIRLALIILAFLVYLASYNLENIIQTSHYISLIILIPFRAFLWVVSCVAETNRTPFDFSEGESELVSGFNIEYGSGGFALIFIAEYARIYFLSLLRVCILWGLTPDFIINQFLVIALVFFWVWCRSTLPRFRYDLLISLAWKDFLPVALGLLEISLFVIYF